MPTAVQNSNSSEATLLSLLPLRRGVLFPGTSLGLGIGRPQSRELIKSLEQGERFVVGFQRDPTMQDPSHADLLPIGVYAKLEKLIKGPGGSLRAVLRGERRCEILSVAQSHPHWRVSVRDVEPIHAQTPETEALASLLADKVAAVTAGANASAIGLALKAQRNRDFARFSDLVASTLGLASDKEVQILLCQDIEERLRLTLQFLGEAEAQADVKSRLSDEVQKQFGKHQREAYLREQLRAIHKELGDESAADAEGEDSLRQRLEEADLPEPVRKVVDRELRRMSQGAGPEQHVIRNYLELIADLPWAERAELSSDIARVATKLDEDHFGLDKVKERILEHLAVEQRVSNHRGAILTLVGPPGVGKTSLGQSISEATGRPFVRVALGGVRDEAEIRGHRRTYVGALPGRIIAALREVKVKNPLILLDEIDKLGQGWMGSPESALLELLDPEQNKHFTDHYLDLPFDLSEALFLCTANTLQSLSAPLRDRLEIVELKGYTPLEKLAIARRHLLPQKLREHALEANSLDVDDVTLLAIIERYTREAGVRQLSRELTRICRALVLRIAREEEQKVETIAIRADSLAELLGKAPFVDDWTERPTVPGVATGLAWTPVGGDVLFVESSRMPGKGRVEITGQLGDVMKESARTALSYLRSHAAELGLEPSMLDDQDVHIHVPAGGIPKDGPSAGITMLAALASLFTNRLVRSDTAMTGEITLRGRVLPVGGITAKILAAHRQGIKRVIMSSRNQRDVDEIPDEVRSEIALIFVDEVAEVLQEALTHAPPVVPHGTSSSVSRGLQA